MIRSHKRLDIIDASVFRWRVCEILALSLAGWQSGYAAACKAVDAGSIPTSASNIEYKFCPGGGIGRHKGLKIPRLNGRAGSIPAPGTIFRA